MTTQAKHTPGPWFIGEREDIRAPYPNHKPGISIASMTCYGAHDVHMAKEANARLIASAPALLEALQACITEDGALAWRNAEMAGRRLEAISQIARSAIHNATGNQ